VNIYVTWAMIHVQINPTSTSDGNVQPHTIHCCNPLNPTPPRQILQQRQKLNETFYLLTAPTYPYLPPPTSLHFLCLTRFRLSLKITLKNMSYQHSIQWRLLEPAYTWVVRGLIFPENRWRHLIAFPSKILVDVSSSVSALG
jgi:hypothetical protein